jgi:uncharacterized protein YgiB involved in biofilm formation
MAENYDERPLRFCDSCGAVDRAPRHVFATAENDGRSDENLALEAVAKASGDVEAVTAVLNAVRDTAAIYKHIDCCAADGCPSGTCTTQLAEAGDKRNEELAAFLAPQED